MELWAAQDCPPGEQHQDCFRHMQEEHENNIIIYGYQQKGFKHLGFINTVTNIWSCTEVTEPQSGNEWFSTNQQLKLKTAP